MSSACKNSGPGPLWVKISRVRQLSTPGAPGSRPLITDTVNLAPEKRFPTLQVLSVGELLAKAIRFTHSDQSVSSLFD